jgi:rRNA biogenesis protein RRP5
MLVQTTVTAVLPNGLNLQVLGFLEGTVDEYHCGTRDIQDKYQVGQKMKARVLCQSDSTSTPPRFALSLAPHVVALEEAHYAAPKDMETDVTLPEAFPIGTILEAVEIRRVEPERGLIVEVASGLDGFIHVSFLTCQVTNPT